MSLKFLNLTTLSLATMALATHAQSYSVDWSTVDGGGGTSTGGVFSVTGTIGQPDAGAMSGGNYSVEGGFWGLIAAVQMPGAPLLSVSRTATNSVLISWPYPSIGFALQQNSVLGTTNWTNVADAPAQVGDQWEVIAQTPSGSRFYRLLK
jgi:hypothetical protein